VFSLPSWELIDRQAADYRENALPPDAAIDIR
jgi:transketolase